MTEEENMKIAINRSISKHWKKLVADSKRISGYNYTQYGEDLLMFCLSEFLSKKSLDYQYKVCVTDNKFPNYMGRAMSLNIKSSSSPFWTHYRKAMYNNRGVYEAEYNDSYVTEHISPNDDFDKQDHQIDAMSCILHQLEHLDFYHKALVEDYFINEMTYKQMNIKYGITLDSLKKGVNNGLKLIKQKCKETIL